MKHLDHIPTAEEAEGSVLPGLFESYWWVTGWDFNRPTLVKVNVVYHVSEGKSVRVHFRENCPQAGFTAQELRGLTFDFYGPIELPDGINLNHPSEPPDIYHPAKPTP